MFPMKMKAKLSKSSVVFVTKQKMGRIKRIWYLSPMRAARVQASLCIHAVSPEPPLLAYTGSVSRGTFKQKARSLAPLNGWACAVKICHDGMLEDTNSLDGAQIIFVTIIIETDWRQKLLIFSNAKGSKLKNLAEILLSFRHVVSDNLCIFAGKL